MKDYEVIIRPHITEKSSAEAATGKYTFIVDKNATKVDVAKAAEKLFSVKVLAVTTMRYDGKKKIRRQNSGAVEGFTASFKKAIVTIDTNPSDKKYKSSIEEFGMAQ